MLKPFTFGRAQVLPLSGELEGAFIRIEGLLPDSSLLLSNFAS